jgi:pimeloyl-ACP methyl ester carboxylesterase
MIHPGAGGCEVYTSLAGKLSNYFSCYGIDSYNLYSKDKIDSLNQLAKYYLSYIDEIMTKTNQGTFHLLGWSLGGQIALEIASILEQRGYRNIKLYLLDVILPDNYICALLDEDMKLQDIDDMIRDGMIKSRYETSYIDKVISTAVLECKLSTQSISSIVKHADILLFKAMLKEISLKTHNNAKIEDYLLTLECNNIDKAVHSTNQIKVIKMLNIHHGNILTKDEFIASEIEGFVASVE